MSVSDFLSEKLVIDSFLFTIVINETFTAAAVSTPWSPFGSFIAPESLVSDWANGV